jgi:hypothetical protein
MSSFELPSASYLFASCFWGSVGLAYTLYGRRQRSLIPFIAGITMIGIAYLIGSAIWMSLVCVALVAGVYVLLKRGY